MQKHARLIRPNPKVWAGDGSNKWAARPGNSGAANDVWASSSERGIILTFSVRQWCIIHWAVSVPQLLIYPAAISLGHKSNQLIPQNVPSAVASVCLSVFTEQLYCSVNRFKSLFKSLKSSLLVFLCFISLLWPTVSLFVRFVWPGTTHWDRDLI